ncbi:MAG: type II secretion system minor pseudopilin GspI [Magnetococcales bacterium]|nr:type II secretion system minor pseudopilin GspI [Magnetococcales bacterium]
MTPRRNPRRTGKSWGGFTLVETLVALVVLAIALSAAIQSMGGFTTTAIHLRDRILALWVAENLATEWQIMQRWPDLGVISGEQTLAGQPWRWQARIVETPDLRMRRMEIDVRDPSGEGEPLARLHSYLGRPY